MSSLQQRLTTATDTRLAVVINAVVNLNVQLCELNELRERVRKAQLSARKSPQRNLPSARRGAGQLTGAASPVNGIVKPVLMPIETSRSDPLKRAWKIAKP